MTLYLMTRSSFENQERNLELKKIPLLQFRIKENTFVAVEYTIN